MRVGIERSEPKEVAFKVSKKDKEHKDHQDWSIYEYDQKLAQLARKLKFGSGKYKGKFPFKCFDCGRIGNFYSSFPYKEKAKMEEDLNFRNKYQIHQKKNPYKKKGFYFKEDSSASESKCEDS